METETTAETAAEQGAPETTPTTANPWEGFEWDGSVDSLPEPVAKAIRDARADAGKARTTAKANAAQEAREQLLAEFAEKLGMGTPEKPLDAAELSRHLEQSRAETAAAQVEMRVFRLATKAGVEPDELLDSRAFCEAVDALDVNDWADFDAKVTELIAQRQAGKSRPAASSTGRPVETLRPGSLAGANEISLDDQIAEAQKAQNWRRVLSLQNQKLTAQQ